MYTVMYTMIDVCYHLFLKYLTNLLIMYLVNLFINSNIIIIICNVFR